MHTAGVEEGRTRTIVLGDTRGGGRLLRVSWHPATSTVVFSHWSGAVCTASTPVSLPEASKLVELLVGALRDAAAAATGAGQSPNRGGPLGRLLGRLRPTRGTVLPLPVGRQARRADTTSAE